MDIDEDDTGTDGDDFGLEVHIGRVHNDEDAILDVDGANLGGSVDNAERDVCRAD